MGNKIGAGEEKLAHAYAGRSIGLAIAFGWLIGGALRSGGDTVFSLILDGLVIWVVGVPLAALGAFAFGLPLQYVYLLALSEEVTKLAAGLWRYFSKKWINNLTRMVEDS